MKTERRRTHLKQARRHRGHRGRMYSKRVRLGWICGLVLIVLVPGLLYIHHYVKQRVGDDRIAANITIGGMDAGGMTIQEAEAALSARLTSLEAVTFRFAMESSSAEATLGELGVSWLDTDPAQLAQEAYDYGRKGGLLKQFRELRKLSGTTKNFDVAYTVDDNTAAGILKDRCKVLENAAVNASIVHGSGGFTITEGQSGYAVDMDATIQSLKDALGVSWNGDGESIDVTMKISDPEITGDMLTGISDLLGSFSTTCGTGGTRVQNIETGTARINGSIVMPGKEFSANDAMEPYTEENGYGEAGSYENGKVVDSMGGGICQVSSTLYNAVLYAELTVTERYEHSLLVTYVKPGKDAAIADTSKDLKFVNNTDTPILIEGYVNGGEVYFNIYGKETRDAARSVDYVSETTSTTDPGMKYVASGEDALGSMTTTQTGHTGLTATLWKIIYQNNTEVSREVVNYSTYKVTDTVISVGISSGNSEASAIVSKAIQSQDKATIDSAISQAEAEISAAASKAAASAAGNTTANTSGSTTNTGTGSASGNASEGSGNGTNE